MMSQSERSSAPGRRARETDPDAPKGDASPTASEKAASRGWPLALVSAAISAALSLSIFAATAARYLTLGDSAEFVAVARTLGVAHPPGYPLYTLLSAVAVRLPFGTPFFRLSMMSAVFGALAAAVVSLLVWELAHPGGLPPRRRGWSAALTRTLGAVVAGAAFSLSPPVWSASTVPEVYSLSVLIVFGSLYLFVRWRRLSEDGLLQEGLRGERSLWVGGLLLGLALAHHLTAMLAIPSAAVALEAGKAGHARSRSVWRTLLFMAFGLSLYVYLPLRSAQDPALLWAPIGSLPDLVAHVSGAQYSSRLFAEPLPGVLHNMGSFFSALPRDLTWPVLSLAALGLCVLWVRSKRLFAVLVLEAVLVVWHAVNYRIPDIESYFIPVYAVLAAAVGLAVAELPSAVSAGARARAVASVALACIASLSLFTAAAVEWPARDLSDDTAGRLYLKRLLSEIPEGAVVLAQNDRTIFPLWYSRFVDGERDDIGIVNIRERAPHLEAWYPSVRFPTENELAASSGRDPSVPCDPPARDVLPVASYLPLLVGLNSGEHSVVADIDIGRDAFPARSVSKGLLVRIVKDSAPQLRSSAGVRLLESYGRQLLAPSVTGADTSRSQVVTPREDGTRDAYATSLADLGQLMLVQGQPRVGIQVLELASEIEPDAAHIRNNLGVAYREVGRTADAYRELRVALSLAPGRASTYQNISRLYLADDNVDGAIDALEKASKLDPGNVRYRLELSSLLEKLGQLDRAESILKWVEHNAGDDLRARLAYGDFLLRNERYTEAVAAYRRAEESRPLSAGVLTSLSRCFYEMEDLDAAIAAMRRSIELQPRNPKLKYDMALLLSKSGRKEEAISYLDDMMVILPTAWQPVALKASLLSDLGLYDESRRLFERAREMGATGGQFGSAWSRMELAAGDTAAARSVLEQSDMSESETQ